MAKSRRAMRPERLGAADLAALVALDRVAQPDHPWPPAHFDAALRQPTNYRLFGVRKGEALAGFAVLALQPFDAELELIAVTPACRRNGMGGALLAHCIAEAREAGKERLLLEVRAGNTGAIALYERAGFRCDGRRRAYYPLADGEREDALLMSLRLG